MDALAGKAEKTEEMLRRGKEAEKQPAATVTLSD